MIANELSTASIDWNSVRRATFEVQQSLRYEYPGPIDDLRQLLILVPPNEVGTQRLLHSELHVTPPARPRYSSDAFGNRVCRLAVPHVERSIEFAVRLTVERERDGSVPVAHVDEAGRFLLPSPLTEPAAALTTVAEELRAAASDPVFLAETVNAWVHEHLTYTPGATGVRTTAADALAQARGVCQDYAHLMLALCRLAGLPARYVSGHLLGEGAMHAWVQVLLPDRAGAPPAWQPFDPTHNRRAGLPYITVAVGRDFADVSPTRGSFRAPYGGRLAAGSKRAGVLAVA